MEFFEVVRTQRAIRRLRTDPIPDSVVRALLEAAVCAPTAGNRQTWRFVVVRDAAVRARLGALYREAFEEQLLEVPFYREAVLDAPDSATGRLLASGRHLAEHLGQAPVLILACVDTEGGAPTIATGASIYPAVQNILLAARALGIGSTLTTIHRYRDAEVKALLGIPPGFETAALIPLGYPLTAFGRPPRRPVEDVVYVDRWGSTTMRPAVEEAKR